MHLICRHAWSFPHVSSSWLSGCFACIGITSTMHSAAFCKQIEFVVSTHDSSRVHGHAQPARSPAAGRAPGPARAAWRWPPSAAPPPPSAPSGRPAAGPAPLPQPVHDVQVSNVVCTPSSVPNICAPTALVQTASKLTSEAGPSMTADLCFCIQTCPSCLTAHIAIAAHMRCTLTSKAWGSTRVLALPPSTRCRSAAADDADGLPPGLDPLPASCRFCSHVKGL